MFLPLFLKFLPDLFFFYTVSEPHCWCTAPNMAGSNLAVGRTNKTYISYKSASKTLWQNVLADTCI